MRAAAPGDELKETRHAAVSRAPVAAPIVTTTSIDPLSDPAWDRLAAAHPEFTFFHGSAWAKVLHGTYGHKPVYCRFYRGDQLAAMLPMMEVRSALIGRRGVCLPFTDICGPLYFGSNEPTQAVLDHLKRTSHERNWKHFEVRGKGAHLPDSKPSLSFYNHILGLRTSPEDLFHRFASSVRRAIKKAGQKGVVAEAGTDLEALMEFYRLHVETRKRHGLPPQPISFFRNIHEHVIKAGLGFVVLARRNASPIAGAIFFHSGKKAIYKFGASDASQQELRGNNLTMWHGIKTLAMRGLESLDFGRTSLINEGLRRFKLSWAVEERIIEYSKFDTARQAWVISHDKTSGLHNAIFRAMPLLMNRLAGALLYPHLD